MANLILELIEKLVRAGYPEGTAKKIATGELPMDFNSRMNRAREQGNRTQAFRVGGVGDDQLGRLEFDPDAAFAQRKGGGTWFAEDAPLTHSYMTPESASYRTLLDTTEYGRLDAGGQNWNDIYYGDFEFPDGTTIPIDELPELLRSKGFEVSGAINTTDKIGRAAKALGLKGVEIPQVIDVGPNRFAMTRNARKTEEGQDWLSDYDMYGGTNISVQDPSTIRSYYGAAFDPDNKGSKNILGSAVPVGVLAALGGMQYLNNARKQSNKEYTMPSMAKVSEGLSRSQSQSPEDNVTPNAILEELLGFLAPTPMGDATMDAYNRNRVR